MSSNDVGIHPGMPATQLQVQPDVTDASPPIEDPADNFSNVPLEVQPEFNRDQAETSNRGIHTP